MPRFIETIIMFLVVGIVLSFLEALGGVLIEKIFGVVFWDYSYSNKVKILLFELILAKRPYPHHLLSPRR